MKLFDQIKNGLGKGADDLGKKVKKMLILDARRGREIPC